MPEESTQVLPDTVIAHEGHKWGAWKVVKEPTVDEEGADIFMLTFED